MESIAGEYVFDYDYTKDCMVYSERYVEDFGRRKVTKNYLENHDPNSQWFIDEVVN